MYQESWYDKLERKYRKYSIRNLMNIIVIGMGVVFLMDLLVTPITGFRLSSILSFSKHDLLHGQLWRLITFIWLPPDSSPLFMIFLLYFYWLIGNALENEWGSFRFNLFYLTGILGTLIAGLITDYATNYYLNLSLFLAFALLYPDYQILVFFVLPVKMKFLALLAAIGLLLMLITGSWAGRIALLVALTNVILFFSSDFIAMIKNAKRRYEFRKGSGNFRR